MNRVFFFLFCSHAIFEMYTLSNKKIFSDFHRDKLVPPLLPPSVFSPPYRVKRNPAAETRTSPISPAAPAIA